MKKNAPAAPPEAPLIDGDQLLMDYQELRDQHARLLSIMAEEDEARRQLLEAQRSVRNLNAMIRRLKCQRAAVVAGQVRRFAKKKE